MIDGLAQWLALQTQLFKTGDDFILIAEYLARLHPMTPSATVTSGYHPSNEVKKQETTPRRAGRKSQPALF
ncbi:hypothetical protein UMZ34_12885 [Halopseudomonas pachastrellae]|nr:hypothetical protein UMZ34_12885 [Halopseudomonas pachastrellae]